MKYKTIPNTDLKVSTICLGTWVFGGDMWGGAKEQECINAVKASLESGINFIDTAPIYGAGVSEQIVGKAIKGMRDEIVLATKCGLLKRNGKIASDLSPESIEKEIGLSLKRLGVDCIDLYQCHWPDVNTPIEKTLDTLIKIKEQGKIKYIGISNFQGDVLRKASKHASIATNQVQYSMLERSIEKDALPYCCENNIGVMTYGGLAGGVLSGKYRTKPNFSSEDARGFFYNKWYSGEGFEKIQKILENFGAIGKPANQIAINWVRQQPGVTSVIVGCRNKNQAQQNAESAEWQLSGDQLAELSDLVQE